MITHSIRKVNRFCVFRGGGRQKHSARALWQQAGEERYHLPDVELFPLSRPALKVGKIHPVLGRMLGENAKE
jgi:hypothetical protein